MTFDFDDRELCRLASQMLDGSEFTGEDHDRLESILANNPAARQRYYQLVALHSQLAWQLGDRDQESGITGAETKSEIQNLKSETNLKSEISNPGYPVDAEIANPHSPPPIPHPSSSPVLGFLSHTSSALSKPILWSILAAGLAFGGYIALITWGIRDREFTPNGTAGVDSLVATITDSSDAQWSSDSSSPLSPDGSGAGGEGVAITQGAPLHLSSGLVELRLKQGATLLVEGPASWSIDGDNRATLTQGKLVAKVPHEAIGFTLDTPTSQIVDLGTEFQAEVTAEGNTDVRVQKGKVEVESTNPKSGGGKKRTLVAGERQRVESSGFAGDTVAGNSTEQPLARTVARGEGPVMVEQGGTFAPNNLARGSGATAFAINCFKHRASDWQLDISYLNDGRYGNRYSWIADSGKPAFAGINLGGKFSINSIAFGRDNGDDLEEGGINRDRCGGEYTLQVTTSENPDEKTPDSAWSTIGLISHPHAEIEIKAGLFKPYLRHRYQFTPVEATGIRLLVPAAGYEDGTCIDEIEVYKVGSE